MLHFFRKKNTQSVEMSAIRVDMHSHILPGIDDGSKTAEESIFLLQGMLDLGYEEFIFSPHILGDYYPNTRDTIASALASLKYHATIMNRFTDVKYSSAAEYFYDDVLRDAVQNKDMLTIGKGNRFLFEISFQLKPQGIQDFIYQAQLKGYKPVLAHPERFTKIPIATLLDWHNRGVEMQLDLLSVLSKRDRVVATRSKEIAAAGVYSFVGSDIHRREHLPQLKEALCHPVVHKLVDSGNLKNHLLRPTED